MSRRPRPLFENTAAPGPWFGVLARGVLVPEILLPGFFHRDVGDCAPTSKKLVSWCPFVSTGGHANPYILQTSTAFCVFVSAARHASPKPPPIEHRLVSNCRPGVATRVFFFCLSCGWLASSSGKVACALWLSVL